MIIVLIMQHCLKRLYSHNKSKSPLYNFFNFYISKLVAKMSYFMFGMFWWAVVWELMCSEPTSPPGLLDCPYYNLDQRAVLLHSPMSIQLWSDGKPILHPALPSRSSEDAEVFQGQRGNVIPPGLPRDLLRAGQTWSTSPGRSPEGTGNGIHLHQVLTADPPCCVTSQLLRWI